MTERHAKAAWGFAGNRDPGEEFYACVGRPFLSSGVIVGAIKVARDGNGSSGFYDRVTVWSRTADLLWEGPLHNLEGVSYV